MSRFVLIRQGYHVLDMVTHENRRFKTCAEAQAKCKELNDWWELVKANGGTDEMYHLHFTKKGRGYNSND